MGITVEDFSTGARAGVTATGNLKTTTGSITEAGFVMLGVENDPGTVGGVPYRKSLRVSENHRLSVGGDTIQFSETFNYTTINTSLFKYPTTTMTVAQSGGYAILNNSSITTINTNAAFQTYKYFSLYGDFEVHGSISGVFTQNPQVNQVYEFGFFQATLPGGAAPTDGVFFRLDATGTLKGVLAYYDGTITVETQGAAMAFPTVGLNHEFTIILDERHAEFWIDGIMQYEIDTPTGQGGPCAAQAQPFTVRTYIGSNAPTVANQFKFSDINIHLVDAVTHKSWGHQLAGMGGHCSQAASGQTPGQTANFANNTAATNAGASNTAATVTGLGGQLLMSTTTTLNTDYILTSYQVPLPANPSISGKSLYITGVTVSTAVVATATVFTGLLSLAYGHTAVSLATTESATSKAPRRVPLGYIGTNATNANQILPDVTLSFDTPICVNPGEYVAVALKFLVSATATANMLHMAVRFGGYWE